MRRALSFLKPSRQGCRHLREKTQRRTGIHHRRLFCEPLEDRRLLSLDLSLVGLDSLNFPMIYVTARATDNGQPVSDLSASNFSVTENGHAQTSFFKVTPPDTGGNVRLADIVFLIDTSGSMGEEIASVRNNVRGFADALEASDVDYRLGLVQFGQSANGGHPLLVGTGLTPDADTFKGWVGTLGADGGSEYGFEAVRLATQQFSFRPGTQKVFVLISDEDSDDRDKQSTINLIQANSVTVHTAVDASFGTSQSDYVDASSIRGVSGGLSFPITGNFTTILDTIAGQTADTYIIRYQTDNPALDGQVRTVVVTATDGTSSDSITATYVPGGAPIIAFTAETTNLLGQSLVAGTSPTISAIVTDATAPFVQGVTLYARKTGSGAAYTTVNMVHQGGNVYAANIPAGLVQSPGVDFFLRATDGQVTSSYPHLDPTTNPYQIAVLPNVAPAISHTPPASALAGQQVDLNVRVLDSTYNVAKVTVYYREKGDLLWNSTTVTYSTSPTDVTETLTIPASNVAGQAIQYYLEATDDLGLSAQWPIGGADHPHELAVAQAILQGTVYVKTGWWIFGTKHALPYARVTLTKDGGGFSQTVYADQSGHYEFGRSGVTTGNYKLTVELKGRPSWVGGDKDLFEVFNDEQAPTVTTKKSFKLEASQASAKSIDIDFADPIGIDWFDNYTTNISETGRLDDLAVAFANMGRYMNFVHDVLSPANPLVPDLDLPVELHLFDADVEKYYGTNAFYISATSGPFDANETYYAGPLSDLGGKWRPNPYVVWHEVSHYLMDDTIGIPGYSGNSHDGYPSSSTAGSWVEGYAEFLPCAVSLSEGSQDWYKYWIYGSLEENYRAWDAEKFTFPDGTKVILQEEELAAAGLLVDLLDGGGNENGWDYIQLSIQDIWGIVGDDTGLDDVKDVYDAFRDSNLLKDTNGNQRDTDGDGISDLDEVFIAHGFFADAQTAGQQGYQVWNTGEDVGRAADAARPTRRSPLPQIPSAYLRVRAVDQAGQPLANGTVRINVEYPAPWEEYNWQDVRPSAQLDDALVYLHPGPTWLNPTITITVEDEAGNPSDSLQFTRSEYRSLISRVDGPQALVHQFEIGSTHQAALGDVFADDLWAEEAWFRAYLELAPGEQADQIDLTSVQIVMVDGVQLSTPIDAASDPGLPFVQNRQTADNDGDGIPELLVKFPKSQVLPLVADSESGLFSATIAWVDSGGTAREGTAFDIAVVPLQVTSVTPQPSGVTVAFNRPPDEGTINVYDVQSGILGPSDVVLVGSTIGAVKGSALVNGDKLTFINTGGPLAADTYTLTLRSASSGIRDSVTGEPLDGEWPGSQPGFPSGDGAPGGDFVYQFTAAAPQPIIVSLPDFARGPSQSLGTAGLPIHLNNAAGVESVDLTLSYNPNLLNITAVSLGPDVVEGSMVRGDFSVPGHVTVSFFALNPLFAGAADIISLSAVVPAGATYGAAEVLHISDVRINEGLLPATADDAIHVVAYPGDATGNGGDLWTNDPSHLEDTYSGLDAQKVSRVAARLDSGFAAYPTIDPVIIGDVTRDGTISGLDASYLLEEATGDCLEIPPLPSPPANAEPIATAQSVTTAEDTAVVILWTGEDGDPEVVQQLTYQVVDPPQHGEFLPILILGEWHYQPDPDFNGTDSFTFTVTDDDQAGPPSNLTSAPATVTITITPVNKRPVANAQSVTTPENIAKAITLTGDDSDPLPGETQALTFAITSQPLHGILTGFNMTTGAVTYTPEHGYFGSDSFSFRVIDDNTAGHPYGLMSDEATVSITVTDVNDPPSFTTGPDQAIDEDAGAQTVAGWATNISPGPPNEAGQALDFIVSADTPALFAVQPAIDATSGTLTYTPAGNANGSTVVTVQLHDNGGTADGGQDTSAPQTFTITINPINDAPSFTKGADQTVNEDAGAQTVAGWASSISAGPADESGQTLTFQVTNDNNALFAVQPAVAANGTLTYTLANNANGSAVVTVQLHDNGGTANGGMDTSPAQTFTITINPVNDAPSFTKGADQTVNEDAGAQTVAGWATSISPGPPDEAAQTVDFQASNDNNALFAVQPAIAANGTLTYTPLPNAFGSATVTVALKDNGGTANGGVDTSASQTFTITVNSVNDAPSFTKGADQTVNEDAGAQTVAGWATNISLGPANEAGQTVTFVVTGNTNAALFAAGPTVDPATGNLSFTPAANANGSATITLVLRDDGGVANGGVDTSPPQTFVITVNPVNDPPTVSVVPNPAETPEDTPITLVVTIDDGDPEVNQQLTITPLSGPDHGTISIPPVGIMVVDPGSIAVIYTPDHNYNGPDGFTFRVTDDAQAGPPANLSTDATVTINVLPINDRPVASPQDLTTPQGTPLPITLNGDDSDPEVEQTLTYAIVDEPQHGTLSDLTFGRQLTYTPNPGYTGPDQFTFIVIDDDKAGPVAYLASQPPAPISITVGSPLLAADAPAADVEVVPLSQTDLQPIVNEAIARWAAAGLSTQAVNALTEAQFVLADLPGVQLGLAAGNTIYLDPNAAGFGWFIDPTPSQDEEFARIGTEDQLRATEPQVIDRMDLLSVVEHELGHLLGLCDLDSIVSSLMGSSLSRGTRRVATPKELDAVFASMFLD